MRLLLSILSSVLLIGAQAQVKYKDYHPFMGDQNSRSSGMYIGLGGSYTFPTSSNDGSFGSGSDQFEIDFSNKGKLGPFFEIGRWHILDYGPFHSIEYGLSYRQYGGKEDFSAMGVPDLLNGEPAATGSGQFNAHYAHLNVMVNRAFKLTRLSFVQASIGADLGYRFINSNEYTFDPQAIETINNAEVESSITSHLNFRLSYGTRVNRMYWMPFIQSPVFNIKELSLKEANLPYFNSRYRPIIFGLRIQWLHHKKDRECAKKGPLNKKSYKKSKSLFGPDMKSKQIRNR